jgi:hypothetical protein
VGRVFVSFIFMIVSIRTSAEIDIPWRVTAIQRFVVHIRCRLCWTDRAICLEREAAVPNMAKISQLSPEFDRTP